MLLSGDMEGDASVQIVNQLNGSLQSVVYKMSHHGASTLANMTGWLIHLNLCLLVVVVIILVDADILGVTQSAGEKLEHHHHDNCSSVLLQWKSWC